MAISVSPWAERGGRGEKDSVDRRLTGASVGNHYDSDGLGTLHGNAKSKSRY
jgi:hypothetical protein